MRIEIKSFTVRDLAEGLRPSHVMALGISEMTQRLGLLRCAFDRAMEQHAEKTRALMENLSRFELSRLDGCKIDRVLLDDLRSVVTEMTREDRRRVEARTRSRAAIQESQRIARRWPSAAPAPAVLHGYPRRCASRRRGRSRS